MDNQQAAIKIIHTLREQGFEALLAGGCVRDRLLGREAKDFDVATSAEPAEVQALFKRTLQVGARFGVVIVMLGKQQVEVATFRIDGSYVDGRRPADVQFTTAQEDAERRDFTINGMFYDPLEDKIIDYVGGQADLQARTIRTIGAPQDRFGEDYLRMLRAVRFAAQLDFTIEAQTLAAIQAGPERIAQISGERISMELQTLLTCNGRVQGIRWLWESGLLAVIFPTLRVSDYKESLAVLAQLRGAVSFPLALAALFVTCDTAAVLTECEKLKLSRREFNHLQFLLDKRGVLLKADLSQAQLRLHLAEEHFRDLYEYQRAIQRAQDRPVDALVSLNRRVRALGDIEIKPDPLLKGATLKKLGVAPGPSFGQCLEAVYHAQLNGQVHSPEQAEAFARIWLAEHASVTPDE